jgi:hypothetical protein
MRVILTMRFFLLLLTTPLIAQSLRVYSEFADINPKGDVTAPAQPREILSPAIVRNGFTSFQIVVQVDPDTDYWLHIGQNPESAVRITVFRESGEKLEPVALPYNGHATQVFWMDLWADRSAPVQRIKVQPALNVDRDWIEYPMEVRVMDAVIQDADRGAKPLCAIAAQPEPSSGADAMHLRNRRQDAALAVHAPQTELKRLLSACDAPQPPGNPEWYLKIRDYLFRLR